MIKISTKQNPQFLMLELSGNLIKEELTPFKEQFDSLGFSGFKGMSFGVAELLTVDSSGLGFLVTLTKELKQVKSKLAIWGLTPDLREIFSLTRLSPLFHFFKNEQEALAFLQQA